MITGYGGREGGGGRDNSPEGRPNPQLDFTIATERGTLR